MIPKSKTLHQTTPEDMILSALDWKESSLSVNIVIVSRTEPTWSFALHTKDNLTEVTLYQIIGRMVEKLSCSEMACELTKSCRKRRAVQRLDLQAANQPENLVPGLDSLVSPPSQGTRL